MDKDEFISKAKLIEDKNNDYSKVEYVNNKTKVCIICPIHGEFWVRPNDFLNGHMCKYCGIEKRSKKELALLINLLVEPNYCFHNMIIH